LANGEFIFFVKPLRKLFFQFSHFFMASELLDIVNKRYWTSLQAVFGLYQSSLLTPTSLVYNPDSRVTMDTFLNSKERQNDVLFLLLTSTKLAEASKVTYLNAVKQYVVYSGVVDYISVLIDSFIHNTRIKITQQEKENKLDGKEKNRWRSWDSILQIWKHMTDRIQDTDPYYYWQQYLCLSLYVLQPPLRLDYGNARIYNERPGKEVENDNYLFFEPEKDQFVFHLGHDKVSNKIGWTEFPFPRELVQIMCKMKLLFGHRAYILTHTKDMLAPLDKEMQKDKFTTPNRNEYKYLLSSIRDAEGIRSHLCVDTLRSACYTAFASQPDRSYADKESLARDMRSSFFMMEKSYRKIVHKECQTCLLIFTKS
jgi:hypothetical protein